MPRAGREEGAEPLEGGLEGCALDGIADANRTLPACTERRPRREPDAMLFEEPAAERERIAEAV
jgi:hypothetical protein